jgi:hypothetical protein
MQPTLHYRHHGFCNVNVIWVACEASTARTLTRIALHTGYFPSDNEPDGIKNAPHNTVGR